MIFLHTKARVLICWNTIYTFQTTRQPKWLAHLTYGFTMFGDSMDFLFLPAWEEPRQKAQLYQGLKIRLGDKEKVKENCTNKRSGRKVAAKRNVWVEANHTSFKSRNVESLWEAFTPGYPKTEPIRKQWQWMDGIISGGHGKKVFLLLDLFITKRNGVFRRFITPIWPAVYVQWEN